MPPIMAGATKAALWPVSLAPAAFQGGLGVGAQRGG